jgi:hypothetical protein
LSGTSTELELDVLAIAPGAREHHPIDVLRFFADPCLFRTACVPGSRPDCVMEAEAEWRRVRAAPRGSGSRSCPATAGS